MNEGAATMAEQDQKQLGNTQWGIADQLRGAMNVDDFHFRDWLPHPSVGTITIKCAL
jgi:hypothetical protein